MAITASSSPNKEQIYDPFRKVWVTATPEEKVRQALLQKMVKELLYPIEFLSVERALCDLCVQSKEKKIPTRRVDIACFAKGGKMGVYPLLVIECKESSTLAKKALSQVKGYNTFLGAPFVAIAYPEGVLFSYFSQNKEYSLDYLPSYQMLLQAVDCG